MAETVSAGSDGDQRATGTPRSRIRIAAVRPMIPPPTTITSVIPPSSRTARPRGPRGMAEAALTPWRRPRKVCLDEHGHGRPFRPDAPPVALRGTRGLEEGPADARRPAAAPGRGGGRRRLSAGAPL